MTVRRDGTQIMTGKTHRSLISGKRAIRFAAKIKDNLDLQVKLLNRELASEHTHSEKARDIDMGN